MKRGSMIEAPDLAALTGIRHGFFTRNGGVSKGVYQSLNIGLGSDDDREAVLENRRRVADGLDVAADRLALPYQIHSPDVAVLDAPWGAEERPRVDAVVTATPGIAVGVTTADCGPVLFADADAGVVGAAHAGWKGAVGGVLDNTIAAMEGKGARRERIHAVLGPTISVKNYEVGPEFVERFLDEDATNRRFFGDAERDGHKYFDLPGYIMQRLERCGVKKAAMLGLCTYADEARFYSYRRATHRREPDYGRLASAIVLAG
ncbi:peptidoglycan editing factor PgeF [Rhodobium orientis]|nr:peptidoglycan editing factor PgeF [Rhodobium orientis]